MKFVILLCLLVAVAFAEPLYSSSSGRGSSGRGISSSGRGLGHYGKGWLKSAYRIIPGHSGRGTKHTYRFAFKEPNGNFRAERRYADGTVKGRVSYPVKGYKTVAFKY